MTKVHPLKKCTDALFHLKIMLLRAPYAQDVKLHGFRTQAETLEHRFFQARLGYIYFEEMDRQCQNKDKTWSGLVRYSHRAFSSWACKMNRLAYQIQRHLIQEYNFQTVQIPSGRN